MQDKAPQTFTGNGAGNVVPAAGQRYLCPNGLNVALATDPDMAEIIVQETTKIERFRVKTTSAQPTGNTGLSLQLVVNGVVVSTQVICTPGEAAGAHEGNFVNGPFDLREDDRVCLGLLNTGSGNSAKIGAFAIG